MYSNQNTSCVIYILHSIHTSSFRTSFTAFPPLSPFIHSSFSPLALRSLFISTPDKTTVAHFLLVSFLNSFGKPMFLRKLSLSRESSPRFYLIPHFLENCQRREDLNHFLIFLLLPFLHLLYLLPRSPFSSFFIQDGGIPAYSSLFGKFYQEETR